MSIRTATGIATTVAVAALGAAAVAGCSSGSSSSASGSAASAGSATSSSAASAGSPEVIAAASASTGYWTAERLKSAQEWQPDALPSESASPAASASESSGSTPTATGNAKTLRIGVLFEHDSSSGNHFCTASVVDSPGHNVLATAAHCVNGGRGGSDKADITFVPAYSDGKAPFGEWTPERYVMDSRWVKDHNENYDVAFVVLKKYEGKNIQDVLGGNAIKFNPGFRHFVRVPGYPSSVEAPITCENWTSEQDGYMKFECNGYYGGTSGSPWITDYNTQTRTGTVVGFLGGYLEGGSVHNISFSSYLGDDIKKLYDDAAG